MKGKLRKGLSLLLAIAMVIVGMNFSSAVNAAAGKPMFTIRTSASTVKPGDIIEAELWLEPNSNFDVFALNFQYDTDVYESVYKGKGDFLKEIDNALDVEEGNISIFADLATCAEVGIEPHGQLYKVKLKVKENAVGAGNIRVDFRDGYVIEDGNSVKLPPKDAVDVVVKDINGNIIKDGDLPVIIELKSISLNKTEPFTMARGMEDDLSVIATPENALLGKTVEWSSSNDKAVTVNDKGHIVAAGIGEATITAKVDDKAASVKITVNAPLESIELNKSTLALRKGAAETLTVSYNPIDTTDAKDVTWTSEDAAIASVDANGKVTALKDGQTTITAKVGEKTATCTVTVKEEPLKGIALDQTAITIAKDTQSQKLNVIYTPEDTTDAKTVTWSSKDEKIATVKDGVVTGKGVGTTTVTAKVGKFSAECKVTVNAPLKGIVLSSNEETILKGKNTTVSVLADPEDTTDSKEVTWSIDNAEIAEMTTAADGKSVTVKGLKEGTAVVTATSVANPELKAVCTVKVKEVPIESIIISDESVALESGETFPLSVKYNPEETTDEKVVTWESTNNEVATVDQNGVVTAVSGGTAKVIAKTANGVTAECNVKVFIHTTGITVTPDKMELLKGQTAAEPLKVEFTPENTEDDKFVKWTSSDESVAVVNEDGYVTGLQEGTAIITATTADGKFSSACEVTVVEVHLTGIVLDENTPKEMLKGQEHTLSVVVEPENTTDEIEFWVSSSDESVATVNEEGVVKALKEGTSTITVTAVVGENSWTVSYELTVKEISLESIEFKDKVETLEEGQIALLQILFNPDNTTDDKLVVWSSSDEKVATVENGLLKALKAGKTTITAKVGELEISYELTVTEKKVPDQGDGDKDDGNKDDGNKGNGGTTQKPGTSKPDNGTAVKTGDTSSIFYIMQTLILLLSVVAIIAFVKNRRRVQR